MNNKNNIKTSKIINMTGLVIALIIIATILANFALADAPNYNFQQFYGEVKGSNDGDIITVKYAEKTIATGVVEQNKYGYKQLLKVNADGLKRGDKIKFFIGKKEIVETEFEPEQATKLDLVLIPEPFCGDKKCLGQESCSSCATDCGECPEDKDNDGIYDNVDRFIASKEKFVERLKNINKDKVKIKVEDKEELKSEYTGKKEIKIEEENKPMIRFEFDFDKKSLDLNKMMIEKQLPMDTQGYTVVKGLSAQQETSATKTVYLDHLKQEIKTVCVKDSEVNNINEITAACNGTSEVFLTCNGSIVEGYKCIDLGNQFEVSGLKNSAVREQQAVQQQIQPDSTPNTERHNQYECEDGKDNDNDGLTDLKDTGCSNSNDDDEYNACQERWECNNWGECKDGTYTRNCAEIKGCGTIKNRPSLKMACKLGVPKNTNKIEEKKKESDIKIVVSEAKTSLEQPIKIKDKTQTQESAVRQSEIKQESPQQLQASGKKKPISKTIIISLVVILAAIGSMLGAMFYNKPGPIPAPPVIAKKEKILTAKRGYDQLKEDDELFEV